MKITKLQLVTVTDSDLIKKGIVAVQLVKFEYSFYGSEMEDVIDTKIMKDGRQIVIDGNGFIKAGTEI
jgi:hypothetical protein